MVDKIFNNFNLFDGINNQIVPNSYMVVDPNGLIKSIGHNYHGSNHNHVDLNDKYVIPGLINVHTHTTMSPDIRANNVDPGPVAATVRSIKHLHQLLKSGVTTIREVGSLYDIDIYLSKLVVNGQLDKSPEIIPSGKAFSMTGGHGDSPHGGHAVDSCDEMRKGVRTALKKGAKNIKMMATGGVTTPGDSMFDPQLSIPEMHTAVIEAHHKGLTACAHAQANPGIMNAIKAGVDSVEHGCFVNDTNINLMLKKGTYLTCTLMPGYVIQQHGSQNIPKYEYQKNARIMEEFFKHIAYAFHRGVKISLGTDAGSPFNTFDLTAKELELMASLPGVSNFDALSTINNSAHLLKLGNKVGSIKSGHLANFLVLNHNPLKDIKAVQQKDKSVYKDGVKEY